MKSELMIHHVETGACEVFRTFDEHMEAPNWCPSGETIYYNGGGHLFGALLSDPTGYKIDTGPHTQLNNDHGVSPDGKTLVFSDKTEDGNSCIYTMPVSGGQPREITAKTPSYWHGWSPDGETLTYTARRNGRFDIFTIPVQGGTETQLTQDMGHCDGPDYTPDGQWIWFNADKTGSAQLWRMHPDGSNLEQMTDDERVNWFPHPSPDGEMLVYLSYPTGTLGHPGDLDVQLRLMSPAGGANRTIVDLHGGQGTINVPSWSPDSRHFAYCRYPKES